MGSAPLFEEGHGVALVALALQFLMFSAAVPTALASHAAPITHPAPANAPPVAVVGPAAPSETARSGR